MYRLVAYHNVEIIRESLEFDRNLDSLKKKAINLDPKDYRNMHLSIENNMGKTVAKFNSDGTKFQEVTHE